MKHHLYLGNGLWQKLGEIAGQEGKTVSSLCRELLGGVLACSDPVRGYVCDGKHTQAARENERVNAILAGRGCR